MNHGRRGPLNISMQNRHHEFLRIGKYTISGDLVYTGGQLYTNHGRRGPLNISMQNRHHEFLRIDKDTISGDLRRCNS
jgi:hypothetical protein